jgi:exopolysaccharide production protein ExoZ
MAKSLARINILQALRTYAALPVVLFHTGYVIQGIHKIWLFGVHMFFLLSGYIMASICATDTHAFLRRRIIRIVPSYWLMTLLLYLVEEKFPDLIKATQAVPGELIKSLLFIPFVKKNGIFQPVLFVGWTVNYETLFYVVLAFSLFLSRRRPLLVASALLLTLVGVSSRFAARSPIALFYSDPIILEFVLGLIVFYCVHLVPPNTVSQLKYLWVSVMVLSLVLLPVIDAFDIFASASGIIRFGFLSFLLVWSSCLLAIAGSDIRPGLIVLIGDASYTLYLTHPYVETFLDKIVAKRLPFFHVTTTFGCLFSVAAAVAVAILLYLKLEKPALAYLTRRFCRRPVDLRSTAATSGVSHADSVESVPQYATARVAE